MPETRIACPRCKTVLSSQTALPAGRLLQCAKCATRFRVPKAAPATRPKVKGPAAPAVKEAKQARETKTPAPTTKAPPAAKAPPPKSTNGAAESTRIICPACQAVMRFAGAIPPGRPIRCAKCATVFRHGGAQTMLAREAEAGKRPAKPTQLRPPPKPDRPIELAKGQAPPPRQARPTKLAGIAKDEKNRPATLLTCAGCGAKMKVNGVIPPGLAIPCPRCQRKLTLPATKKTVLAPAKPATMLLPAAKPTQIAPKGPAKKTQLAPPDKPKQTKLAPTAPARFRCPACKAVLSFAAPVPAGRAIKCPKCARLFRFQPKTKSAPAPQSKPAPTPKTPKPIPPPKAAADAKAKTRTSRSRTSAKQWRYAAAGVLLFAIALGAFWLGKSLWSTDIPESEWVEFVPPGGGCRVLLPGEPEETTAKSPTVTTYKFTVKREVVKRGWTGVPVGAAEKAFMLEYSDRSDGAPSFDRAYAAHREAIIRHFHGTLGEERDLMLGPQRGKEFVIQADVEGLVIGRFYLVKNRAYVLLAVGAYLRPGQGDAARFFDSFQLH